MTETTAKLIGKIINPSDDYTIDCTDRVAACFVVYYLGSGWFGIHDAKSGTILPLGVGMPWGPREWFCQEFGIELVSYLKSHATDVARACRSIVIGGFDDRKLFEASLAVLPESAQQVFRDEWHDERRSSLNDIGGVAANWADKLEKVDAQVEA